MIPEEIVEQIKSESDIVGIIGEDVNLIQRGRNFVGLCPFHNEKTPSFTVTPEKNIYKCFGCGKAGNAITFSMEFRGLTYPEALRYVASKSGIHIPENLTKGEKQKQGKKEQAFEAAELASEFFHKLLFEKPGKHALDYFLGRGFSSESITKFRLGFAPDSWDATGKYLKKKNISEEAINNAGLLVEKDSGGFYDRFRGRAIFPVRDFLGRVIAFGARILSEENNQPKYINSPQCLIYDKSKVLYGLYEAKQEIRKQNGALLTEGYSDVISLHQAGFENAIASSGTSLTNEQLHLLYRYTKTIFLVYDSDNAGLKAAERAIELALPFGFSVRVVKLEKGEDPDSIIKKGGKSSFDFYLRGAGDFVKFVVGNREESKDFERPEYRSKLMSYLVRLVKSIPERLQHDFYIEAINNRLGLNARQIEEIYREKGKPDNKSRSNSGNNGSTIEFHDLTESDTSTKLKEIRERIANLGGAEREIFKMAVQSQADFMKLRKEYNIGPEDMTSADGSRIMGIISEIADEGKDILDASITGNMPESFKLILTEFAFEGDSPSAKWTEFTGEREPLDKKRLFKDIAGKLRLAQLERERNKLLNLMKSEKGSVKEIQMRIVQIDNERNSIIADSER